MVKTKETEDDIVRELRTKVARVFVSGVPDVNATPQMPYVVLYFSPPIRAARDRGIVSTRHDTNLLGVSVEIVSTTDDSARAVQDIVLDTLVGYRPTNSGELILEGGTSYASAATTVKPSRYTRSIGFTARTNLSW